jgi:hypothetical protein
MALTAIHPGEHLAAELQELGMSAAELARSSRFRPAPSSGSTCKVFMSHASRRRGVGKSIKELPTEQDHA